MTFHDRLRIPLVWPAKSLKGYWQLRKSHICMDGLRSSSYATTSWVGTSGCHTTLEHRNLLAGSLKLITSFFIFRSHTTVVPWLDEEQRMCWTLRFQAQASTSDPACLLLLPGLYRSGCVGLSMFTMFTSESLPQVARRLALLGWNSMQLTS